jgi:hypothetical protein
LIHARETLVEKLRKELTHGEREFLVSLKACQPRWHTTGIEGVDKLPAVQWKLMNIKKIGAKKQKDLLEKLKRVLEL